MRLRSVARLASAFIAGTLAMGCRGASGPAPDSSPAWFEDIAARAGIDFVHRSGHGSRHYLPEIMGGGAALFDMDNDGLLDLYLVQSGSLVDPSSGTGGRLYHNLGGGRFEDVTDASGAGTRGYGMGVAAGDFDNDGHTDLYITNLGRNVLLRNDGHGHFVDVTAKAGVASAGCDQRRLPRLRRRRVRRSSPLPELVMSGEVECFSLTGVPDYCSPASYDLPSASTLFHNNGNGTFTDVSQSAGVLGAVGNGLGVVAGDFDGDGRVDLFVANDRTPNHLWLNQGNGRFRESALAMGCALDQDGVAKSGMGVYAVDADDDGDLDLLVVNLDGESDSFFRNQVRFFVDDTVSRAERRRPFTRFGTARWTSTTTARSIFKANGRVGVLSVSRTLCRNRAAAAWLPGPRFEEVRPRGGTRSLLVAASRAAAFGDIDNDGGIDVVVVNRDARPYVLHNIVSARGHWAMVRVLDEHNRDALGARVTMTVGSRAIRRDVRAAFSYLASNDPRVHIGLGQDTVARNVVVRWVDGRREAFEDVRADHMTVLRRGGGRAQ
jgi:hypothetical protein